MRTKFSLFLLSSLFLMGCAGAHYQALPGAPRMEEGQQRIAMNINMSIGQKRKLKWYIPKNWWISNWGYSFEYRYGIGDDMDIGIYPAGLKILPCAIDLRWVDKEEKDSLNFQRLEFFNNPVTHNERITNSGIRYDYFIKKREPDNMERVQGISLLFLNFQDISNGIKNYDHPIVGFFVGAESESILYEIDYLPGFNYFMEKPEAKNPLFNFSSEKEKIPYFLSGDFFIGISHGNSYKE